MKISKLDIINVVTQTKTGLHFIVKGRYSDLIDGSDMMVVTDTKKTLDVKADTMSNLRVMIYGDYKNLIDKQ